MFDAIRQVILPTDFSPPAEAALRTAARLTRDDAPTFHLVHVVQLPVLHTTEDLNVPTSIWTGLREAAEERLAEAEATLRAEGIDRVERHLGNTLPPAEYVIERATALDADLVAIGTHGRSGIAHAFLGSIAEATVRTCTVPVLTVKPPGLAEAAPRRVLVATDFSAQAEQAERLGVSLATRFGAEVELIHVLEQAPEYALRVVAEIAQWENEVRADLEGRLATRAEKLEAQGLRVGRSLPKGDPATRIVERAQAWGADLVVMGTHSRRGLDHFLIGSVAERTLRTATCPVLTTRAIAEND